MTAQNFDAAFLLLLPIIRIPRTALLFTSNDCELLLHSFDVKKTPQSCGYNEHFHTSAQDWNTIPSAC